MHIIQRPVPGTSRQTVILADGKQLERQFIYLRAGTWEALKALARKQGTSGSVVIDRLIWLATMSSGAKAVAR